jgi:N-methylhydantoinase B
LKDTLWLTAGQHYLSPFRTKKPSGVGANGGNAGPNGAMWLFPPTTDAPVNGLIDTADSAYVQSEPVAGVLNPSTHALDPENGEYNYFASRQVWATAPNTILRCLTNGGGGWGDPFARDPERVLADVRNEYVSIDAAAAQYGVVVVGDPRNDPEALRVDVAGTDALRGKAQ